MDEPGVHKMKKLRRLEIENQFLRKQLEAIRRIADEPPCAENYNPDRKLGRIGYLADYGERLECRMHEAELKIRNAPGSCNSNRGKRKNFSLIV